MALLLKCLRDVRARSGEAEMLPAIADRPTEAARHRGVGSPAGASTPPFPWPTRPPAWAFDAATKAGGDSIRVAFD